MRDGAWWFTVRWHSYQPTTVRFPRDLAEYSLNLWESDLMLFEVLTVEEEKAARKQTPKSPVAMPRREQLSLPFGDYWCLSDYVRSLPAARQSNGILSDSWWGANCSSASPESQAFRSQNSGIAPIQEHSGAYGTLPVDSLWHINVDLAGKDRSTRNSMRRHCCREGMPRWVLPASV